MKKRICLVLTVCMVTSLLWGCGQAKKETTETKENAVETTAVAENEPETEAEKQLGAGYTISEVGTISDPDKELKIADYSFDGVASYEGTTAKMLTYLGEDKLGKSYIASKKLSDGVYTVAIEGEDINVWGLVNNEGEELVPCEAAQISALSDRYYMVTYTTGETKDEAECFVYSTDSMFSMGVDVGDTMYKGYAQIYDIQQSRFIPNVKVTYASGKVEACGNSVYLIDESGTQHLYNAEGEEVYKTEDNISLGNGVFTIMINNEYCAFDENGTKLFSKEDSVSNISGNGQYFYMNDYDNDKKIILDKNGNELFEYPGKYISEINDDIVMGCDDNDKYGLHKIDGTEIVPFESDRTYDYSSDGYWDTADDDYENYTLINSNGVLSKELNEIDGEKLVYRVNQEENAPLLVLGSSKDSIEVKGSVTAIDVGLVVDSADDDQGYRKEAVIDLFTGEILIDYEYEDIAYESGYLYGYKDGTWTVYKVSR